MEDKIKKVKYKTSELICIVKGRKEFDKNYEPQLSDFILQMSDENPALVTRL